MCILFCSVIYLGFCISPYLLFFVRYWHFEDSFRRECLFVFFFVFIIIYSFHIVFFMYIGALKMFLWELFISALQYLWLFVLFIFNFSRYVNGPFMISKFVTSLHQVCVWPQAGRSCAISLTKTNYKLTYCVYLNCFLRFLGCVTDLFRYHFSL